LAVSATVFEILTLKARKLLNFSDRPLFEAPVRGGGLEFVDEIWRQKTEVLGLLDGEEIMTLAFFVLTQYRRVTDRQIDGHVAIAITSARSGGGDPLEFVDEIWRQKTAASILFG